MSRIILALLVSTAATPALAQHSGNGQAAPAPVPAPAAAPAATCTPEHAAMGHCTLPAQASAPPTRADPHAGHAKSTEQDPPSGAATCSPEHAAMGHCTPSTAAEVPVAPPPPEALSGPTYAQDLFFNPAEAGRSRAELAQEHGGLSAYKFLIDQLEMTVGEEREGYAWDAQFWYGGDIDKLWVKTEGEGEFGEDLESAEIQALWSRAIDPWFDVQAGARQDLNAGPDRTHLVLGVQGLAPYWFEVDGAVFLSTEGEVTARFEAEYDLRLTQQLILQPLVEVNFSLQDVQELGLGSGLTSTEIGARLRHQFFPVDGPAVIAPYVGIEYEQAWGGTKDLRATTGEDANAVRLLAGVRLWF